MNDCVGHDWFQVTNVLTYKRYTLYYKRIPHEVVIIYQSVGFGVVTEKGTRVNVYPAFWWTRQPFEQ